MRLAIKGFDGCTVDLKAGIVYSHMNKALKVYSDGTVRIRGRKMSVRTLCQLATVGTVHHEVSSVLTKHRKELKSNLGVTSLNSRRNKTKKIGQHSLQLKSVSELSIDQQSKVNDVSTQFNYEANDNGVGNTVRNINNMVDYYAEENLPRENSKVASKIQDMKKDKREERAKIRLLIERFKRKEVGMVYAQQVLNTKFGFGKYKYNLDRSVKDISNGRKI